MKLTTTYCSGGHSGDPIDVPLALDRLADYAETHGLTREFEPTGRTLWLTTGHGREMLKLSGGYVPGSWWIGDTYYATMRKFEQAAKAEIRWMAA